MGRCFKDGLTVENMNWIVLVVAGLFEVAFAFCLGKAKTSVANEKVYWYAGFVVALLLSMTLLVKATQSLPIGTAYAVWTDRKSVV